MAKAKTATDDLYDALTEDAEPVDQKKGNKKKDRPHIELDANEQKAFEAFCAADIVMKMAEGKQTASKTLIVPFLRRRLLEEWVRQGHKTDNPVVQTGNARANFIVRNILKVELPEKSDGSPASIKDRLTEIGFDEEEAEAIYDREFTESVETNFRNLNELRNGDPNQVKAVTKLMQLVKDNFSPEERRLLTRKETKVEINDGFLDRAVQHCNEDVDKLDRLLSVVAPQWVLSHMTYSGRDLRQAVADLTGGELPVATETSSGAAEEFYSVDKLWKAVAKGSDALLYMCGDTGDILLGTKKCSGGPDHARMTCKKWMRDETYRETSMVDFKKKK